MKSEKKLYIITIILLFLTLLITYITGFQSLYIYILVIASLFSAIISFLHCKFILVNEKNDKYKATIVLLSIIVVICYILEMVNRVNVQFYLSAQYLLIPSIFFQIFFGKKFKVL